MILVIGGAWQGKTEYVSHQLLKELAESCPETEVVVKNAYQETVRAQLQAGGEPLLEAERLLEEVEGQGKILVVICNEVGYGVVPMDAFERAWREKTGRVCCWFAQKAGQVIRVVCGVGTRIK